MEYDDGAVDKPYRVVYEYADGNVYIGVKQFVNKLLAQSYCDLLNKMRDHSQHFCYPVTLERANQLKKTIKKFELGDVEGTPEAIARLKKNGIEMNTLLHRHQCGDWGDIDSKGWEANNLCLATGKGHLFSAYKMPQGGEVWVVTFWDKNLTCIRMP